MALPRSVLSTALLSLAAALPAMENQPLALSFGFAHLWDDGARELVETEDPEWNDRYGYYGCLGFSAPQRAMFGYPWIDFAGTRHEGNDNRIDSLGVLYVERAPITEAFYIGAGIGSFYNDVRLTMPGKVVRDNNWRIGGKVLAGINFGPNLFIEASYQYSDEVHEVETSSANLAVGIRF
jgi:hypothetical protein